MVFGPSGQFKFDGSQAITPANAALPMTSAYELDITAAPEIIGNEIYFATSFGWSYGLSKFTLSDAVDGQYLSTPLADHVIGGLLGSCRKISAANNLGVIATLGAFETGLSVLEWYKDGDNPDIPAWAYWWFEHGLRIIDIRARADYIDVAATGLTGAADENTMRIYRFNLFNERKFLSSWGDVYLDCLKTVFAQTVIFIGADYPVHAEDGLDGIVLVDSRDGAVIPYTRDGNEFLFDQPLSELTNVHYGYNYASSIVPPTIVTSDASGIIQTNAHLRITDWDITLTGHVACQANTAWNTQGELYEWQGQRVGDWDFTTDAVAYNRKTFRFPFMHPAGDADLKLATTTHIGCNIHSLEWRGTYYKTGRRF
jgi:hypothetical protein